MNQLVTMEIRDGIADVRLNRPEKYNALSPGMVEAIIAAADQVAADRSVRVVVLSGNGRGFCSGLDFESFQKFAEAGSPESASQSFETREGDPSTNNYQRVAYAWKLLPVPVIAALHGVAFGGGLQIALAADLRIADPKTRLSIMEIKWGLVPDMSGTQTLRHLVRLDVAKELTFSGRILKAEEGAGLGLVTRVSDRPLEDAMEMAREIAAKSPSAIAAGKQLLETAWRSDVETGLALEAQLQFSLIGGPNQVEAVNANFENRSPEFRER